MPYLRRRTARSYHLHGVTFRSVVSGATGATQQAAWRADFAPDTPGQPHRMSHEEVLHVLEGELDVRLGDEQFVAGAGDTVLVPREQLFQVGNNSSGPASAWVTTGVGMTARLGDGQESMAPPWAQ